MLAEALIQSDVGIECFQEEQRVTSAEEVRSAALDIGSEIVEHVLERPRRVSMCSEPQEFVHELAKHNRRGVELACGDIISTTEGATL